MPPEPVAGHRLLSVLGSGGNGTVYSAAPRDGGPRIALKIIPGPLRDEHARRRFMRGAEAARRLRHPNVVRVIGSGETCDGGLFLAMELLEGEDLGVRLARGRLGAPEAAAIGIAATAALGAAHAAGIVHRDVKPGNVFICADGAVKILDFGVALYVADGDDTRLTGAGSIVGTPAYMAIEQARGTRDEDQRTDVWGLGATLYHAVAGAPPFDAPTPLAQLVRAVTDEPDALPREVPVWMRDAILRSLRKDRSARWQTMAAFGEALEQGRRRGDASLGRLEAGHHPALGEEVRVVAVLLADGVASPPAFSAAVRAEGGLGLVLMDRQAVGVFGGEAWQGDEAERAVRAGLAARSKGAAGRLGVATGRGLQALAGEVTGGVVASAQAVLSSIGVGADAETQRRISGAYDVEAGRVLRRRQGLTVVGIRGLSGADLPLCGRQREKADLETTLAQVIDESQAAGVLLVGAPGIGKSRLVHALQLHIEGLPLAVYDLEGRGEANRAGKEWHAIENALRLRAEIPEGTPRAVAQERLLHLCPTRRCAELLGEILGTGLQGPRRSPPTRDELLTALGDLFESMAREHPVVLVLEDVQWADASSLALCEMLLHRLERQPFFLLATARPELEAHLPDFRRIALGGISRQATRALVGTVLGDGPDVAQKAAAIHERSGGNPFFAEELALALRDGLEELPESVAAATQARLDVLPPEEKDLLRRASVLGRRFWAEALFAMGVGDPTTLLGRLRRRELVSPEPKALLEGTTEWRFRHALVQEVAYGSLTPEQRASLHAAAARWLDARADAPPLEVARHRDPLPEAPTPYWLRAADVAFRDGDTAQVLSASSCALERLEGREVALHRGAAFRLRSMRAAVLSALGRGREEEAEMEAMGLLASSESESALVHERRAALLRRRGHLDEAAGMLERGLLFAPDNGALLVEEAFTRAMSGRPTDGLEPARRAGLAAKRAGDTQVLGRALVAEAYCHDLVGDVGLALPLYEQALATMEAVGDPMRVATVRGHIASCMLGLGRHDEAARALERARSFCRAVGNRRSEGYALRDLGLALARTGDPTAGQSAVSAALAISAEVEDPRLRMHCLRLHASILLEMGRAADALGAVDEAVATPAPLQGSHAASMLASRAAVLLELGRRSEARDECRRAIDLRDAAGGMQELETELFLAANAAGIEGALDRGVRILRSRAAKIASPELRRSFLEDVPSHARLLELDAI